MTGPDRNSPGNPVEQATADLERLRELLLAAGREQVDLIELREALQDYWRANRPVLTALAAAVGEQLRLQTLQALHEWRANLDTSLPSHRRPKA